MTPSALLLVGLVLSGVSDVEGPQPASADPLAGLPGNGLYPLWENTGVDLGGKQLFLGTSHLEVELGGVLQLGVRPVEFAFRTPNAHLKLSWYRTGRLAFSSQLEVLALLPGASTAFTSSNFSSRLDSGLDTLIVIPASTSVTWRPLEHFALHATATVLTTQGGQLGQQRSTFGLFAAAEVPALEHHALTLHVGEAGFWRHDHFAVGLSYRYHRAWFDGRLGYVFRVTPDGRQGSPMLSLAVAL